VPLPGASNFKAFAAVFLESNELPHKVKARLLRVYGSRTQELLQLCASRSALGLPFNKAGDALAAEIVFAFESESATTLVDCLLRRTMIGLNADLAIGDDEAAAEIAKRFLGWSEQQAEREVKAYRNYVKKLRVHESISSETQ
jgi:glycerol-3-phosphate dehydrogenase